jgi:hypothetical protein
VSTFSYNSLESAEDPLLAFQSHDSGWILHSPSHGPDVRLGCTTQEIRDEASRFVDAVRAEAKKQLHIDVDVVLQEGNEA